MTVPARQPAAPAVRLPQAAVFVAGMRQGAVLLPDGEILTDAVEAAWRMARKDGAPIVCHAPSLFRRFRADPVPALDVLELFAFVHPATFCLPTPRGLAAVCGLPVPGGLEDQAAALFKAAEALLARLADRTALSGRDTVPVARAMAAGGWPWGPAVMAALGETIPEELDARAVAGLEVWRRLDAWSEHAPEPPPGNIPVEPEEARTRLAGLLGGDAEPRPGQADYASAATAAFRAPDAAGAPNFLLAEAGTGVGKTLGYVAPATVWAEKNGAPVWISTFTRNLQHQIDQELDRAWPDPVTKKRRMVVRKGRENYFCLLNMEEAVRGARVRARDAVSLGLVARWAAATRDGDIVGGDFPGWLRDLVGRGQARELADRRGECIYSACPHYQKCFIESSVRRARRADIVVANHALVMIQAALGGYDDRYVPARYVFDEGHHLFHAADGAFSAHLTGREMAELRRWLRGAEGRNTRSRARGLKGRAGDLIEGDPEGDDLLAAALRAAAVLPGDGWAARVAGQQPGQSGKGAGEAFLGLVRQQVYARAQGRNGPYSLETTADPPVEGLVEAAQALHRNLTGLRDPLAKLIRFLLARLDAEADELDTATRLRIESVCRSLERRALNQIGNWMSMLETVAGETPPEFVDWLSVDREFGNDVDVGMHRHWVDPTFPFAEQVAMKAQGVMVTSATLRDGTGDLEADWHAAEAMTGALHLPTPATRATASSPFDYAAATRVFIVTDVRKDDLDQVSAAYRELFLASGGGALGLFTAIARLRAVHRKIVPALDDAGLQLLAQHIDGLDTATLVDIFRAEPDSCLLGTDALRDGVDVPGEALRLIVFDRVPWPRPDILHKARKAAFGGRAYDDMITRMRLKQAYGRLVRREGDRGVFVLLDPMMPSRLFGAFPEGVEPVRCGLADTLAGAREFLGGG